MAHRERTARRARRELANVFENQVALARPVVARIQEVCDDCGGSGVDIGGLSATEAVVCPSCDGRGRQIVVRNYLAEALRIAAGQAQERLN